VGDVGQDRETVLRHVLTHPARVLEAAAEQLVELDDVLGSEHVAVAVHQHDGHAQLLHVLGPVKGLAHPRAHLIEQLREIRRLRRDGDV